MSQGSRAALILAALAVLVGGFFLAQGSSDEGSGDDDPPATAAQTTPAATTPPSTTTTTAKPTPPPIPTIPTIRVEGGKPVGGIRSLRVDKGERVRFRVRSDVAEEVHVHGYDIAKDVAAGSSVTFSFDAEIDGKFEIELEHSHVQIASLAIAP